MFTRCPNLVCPGRQWQLLKAFAGIMEMEGVGEKQVAAFQEAGLLRTAADFYRLDKERLTALERVGETSAENMLRVIEASKSQPFESGLRPGVAATLGSVES